MLQSIERFLKQAIVDKVHAVSSAALISSLVTTTRHLHVTSALHTVKVFIVFAYICSNVEAGMCACLFTAAPGEDEPGRGEALGERGAGGRQQRQRHGSS